MSMVAMKRKTEAKYASSNSGRAPNGYSLPLSRPCCENKESDVLFAPVGFSLHGTHRNVGRVGQDMCMSKSNSVFRGFPNVGIQVTQEVVIKGPDSTFTKPICLSAFAMMRRRRAANVQYPHYWVQPIYTGDQAATTSQGQYLRQLESKAIRSLHTNTTSSSSSSTHLGKKSCVRCPQKKGEDVSSGKMRVPIDAATYLKFRTRPCLNPRPSQMPYPPAVQTGMSGGIGHEGLSGSRVSCF